MTPEELLRAGIDPSAYYPDWNSTANLASEARAGNVPAEMLGKTRATTIKPGTTGVNPQGLEALKQKTAGYLQQGGQMFGNMQAELEKPGGALRNVKGDYRGAGGGKSGALLSGVSTLLSGDPLGAAISTPIGVGAGMAANAAVNVLTQGMMAGPPPMKLAGMGLRFLAPALIGGGVQQGVAGLVGGGKKAAEEAASSVSGPDISILGIPLTEAARIKQTRERDLAFQQQSMNALGTTQLGLDRQTLQMNREDEVLRNKAMLPMMERIQRNNLVNAQAMLASQTASYQALGRQAGMFKLAQGAQAESGATLRTAISQNPYMGATLSAPSISFG
jgi:hypothetical protein